VLGSAQGLWLVTTKTPGELWRWYVDHLYDFSIAWIAYDFPLVLVPGWLGSLRPWEYWPHTVNFLLTFGSLCLLGSGLRLKGWEWAALWLGWTASGTLLSWSICGFGYISSIWPYAVAIWIVLRLGSHPFWTLVLCAVTYVLAWQVQELGRTVFVVFLAAALFLRNATATTRVVWLLAGAWALVDSVRYPNFHTSNYVKVDLSEVSVERLLDLGRRILLQNQLDLPTLLLLGAAVLVVMRRHAGFWRAIVGLQLALVIVLGLNTGILKGPNAVWPRRFLLTDFLCLAAVVAFVRDARGRRLLVGTVLSGLVIGAVLQLADVWRWSRLPLDHEAKGWDFPLPFTWSAIDYSVPFATVDFARQVEADVRRGRKVILVYNLDSYEENATNPVALPERLYVALGPDRYSRSVFIFGSQNVRWTTVPVRPLTELDGFARGIEEPSRFVGYERMHPQDSPSFEREAERIVDTLGRHWRLHWKDGRDVPPDVGHIRRFRLRRLASH